MKAQGKRMIHDTTDRIFNWAWRAVGRAVVVGLMAMLVACAGTKKTASTADEVRFSAPTTDLHKLEEAIEVAPGNPDVFYDYGVALKSEGRFEDAVAYFDSALALDPTYIRAKIEKGEALILNGREVEGYRLYQDLLNSGLAHQYTENIAARIGQPFRIDQLTSGRYHSAFPAPSPDGKRLAFQSTRDGNWELYEMDLATGNAVRITNDASRDEHPAYSRDGGALVFTSTRFDSVHTQAHEMVRELMLVRVASRETSRLTANRADDWYPSLGPSSVEVLFASEAGDVRQVDARERFSHVFLKDLRNTTEAQLTSGAYDCGAPSFNSTGETIIYQSNRSGGYELYRMSRSGHDKERLTAGSGEKSSPRFSPDGKHIVFVMLRDGNYEVYQMNQFGRNMLRLTNNPSIDGAPRYAPDGLKIYFHSKRSGRYQLYAIDLTRPTSQDDLKKILMRRIVAAASN